MKVALSLERAIQGTCGLTRGKIHLTIHLGDPWVIHTIPATVSFSLWSPVPFPTDWEPGVKVLGLKKWTGVYRADESSDQNQKFCLSLSPLVWHFSTLKFPNITNTLVLSSWIISLKRKLENSQLPTIYPSCNHYQHKQDPDQCAFIRQEHPKRTWVQAFPLQWKYWREGLYL